MGDDVMVGTAAPWSKSVRDFAVRIVDLRARAER